MNIQWDSDVQETPQPIELKQQAVKKISAGKIEWNKPTIQWDEEPSEVKTDEKTGIIDNIVNDLKLTGKNLKYGYDLSAEQLYHVAANVPMLINEANDYLVEKTGIGKPSEETVLKTVENWLRNASKAVAPPDEGAPKDIIGKIYAGIGSAPGTIATYLPAVKALGVIGGMATVGGLSKADEGLKETAIAAAKGAAFGSMIKAVEPYAASVRIPAMATAGAATTAAEGGDVTDIVSNAAVMGGLAAMGPSGGVGGKDIIPAKKPIESAKIEPDIQAAQTKTKAFAGNINLDKIDTETAVKQTLKDIAEQYQGFTGARRDVVSHEETKLLAKELGLTEEKLMARRQGQALNAHEAYAARTMLVNSAEKLTGLAEKVKGGSAEDIVEFQKHLTRHVSIQEQVSGMTAEAGRALNQFKIEAKSSKAKLDAINTIIESHGGRAQIEKVAEALADPANINKINELSQKLFRPKPSDIAVEVWINALLSGPQTHAVNVTSNALTALWTLPENLLAAGIGKITRGNDKVFFRDVIARGYGFVEGAKEGVIRMAETLRTGEPFDPLSKIEAAKYNVIPGKLGTVVRLPGRFLTSEDEFFKQIGYRMEINSLAYRTAINEGLKGRDLATRVEELKVSPTEEMNTKALATSRYQTFTKPLGAMGQSVQAFAASHPVVKVVIPFIRTPANIVKFAGERTPLSLFSKNVRDTLRKGGAERDQQLAKIAFGSMVSATVAAMVQEGTITGGGPSDKDQKAMLYETGWQPYSIKINDQYYAYNRIEPVGIIVGITADAAEISDKIKPEELDKLTAMVFASISKNLTSKTWLRGMSDLIQAINDPDRYGERYLQNLAATLIPTGIAQIAKTIDPVVHETTTVLDKLKSRIPYVSESLLPKRNIWGEKITLEGGMGPDIISPIYTSKIKNDKVSSELVRLEIAPGMPGKKISRIQLTPDQYDEYAKNAGELIKKYLDELMALDTWEQFPDVIKTEMIMDGFNEFRGLARNQMLLKHPDLIKADIQDKINKYRSQ